MRFMPTDKVRLRDDCSIVAAFPFRGSEFRYVVRIGHLDLFAVLPEEALTHVPPIVTKSEVTKHD